MTEPPDDDGLADLIAALDELRGPNAGPHADTSMNEMPRLGGGATDLDFTATLLTILVSAAVRSPTIARWIDELAPAGDQEARVELSARSLLADYHEPGSVVVAVADALLAAREPGALAALLRFTTDVAGYHPARREVLATLLHGRLVPLCELAVTSPAGPLPAALARALQVVPAYSPELQPLLDGAGPELIDLTIALNAAAVSFWDQYSERDTEHAGELRAAVAEELGRYARNLIAAGRPREAVTTARRAVAIVEEPSATDPAEFFGDLATALGVLVHALKQAGQQPAVPDAVERAVAVAHSLLARIGDPVSVSVCNALSRMATLAQANGCVSAACRTGLSCLDLQMRLPDPVPEQRAAFCESSRVIAQWLLSEDATSDAVAALDRAAVVAAELSSSDDAYIAVEVSVLTDLSAALAAAGRTADAADAANAAEVARRRAALGGRMADPPA